MAIAIPHSPLMLKPYASLALMSYYSCDDAYGFLWMSFTPHFETLQVIPSGFTLIAHSLENSLGISNQSRITHICRKRARVYQTSHFRLCKENVNHLPRPYKESQGKSNQPLDRASRVQTLQTLLTALEKSQGISNQLSSSVRTR